MAEFVMIVPTRGRPQAVGELAGAFAATCTAQTRLLIAVDDDDPDLPAYREAVDEAQKVFAATRLVVQESPGNMATALNMAVSWVLSQDEVSAVGFMGDDHRPRTRSWDRLYLNALMRRPGIVFGNDLIHGERLPTQFTVSWKVTKTLGFFSPAGLKHMYIDNYWKDIGDRSNTLTYLEDVVVEHMHPVAEKGQYDEGYERVNAPEIYEHDAGVYAAYMEQFADRDVAAIRGAVG